MPTGGPLHPRAQRGDASGGRGLRARLLQLAASYDRRLRGGRAQRQPQAHRCAVEMREQILAPVLGIAAQNPEIDDERLAHLLRVTLARRRTSPPPLAPDADDAARRTRDAAWGREFRRVRDCLRQTDG